MLIGLTVGIPFLIGVIVLLWLWHQWPWQGTTKASDGTIDFAAACGIISLCVSAIVGMVFVGICVSKVGQAARVEAFYEANVNNYAVTVTATEAVLSETEFLEGILVEGSLEKFEYATQVALRIQEWRDAVNSYNTQLQLIRTFDRNIVVGCIYPTLPEHIVLLRIGD